MKIRDKNNTWTGESSRFNTHALSEIIIGYNGEGGMDSEYIKNCEVLLSSGKWKDMWEAFRDKDIIPDNYNEWFGEPRNEEDKTRGYFL